MPDVGALAPVIEALVLSSDRPLSSGRLAEAAGLEAAGAAGAIRDAIAHLNEQYQATGRVFRIEPVAGGFRAVALPAYAGALAALHGARESHTLSRAALETLSIIAYRQPVTRADLEAIRGVACGEVLRSLLDKRLVDIAGRAEELGRPMLYATTRRFLEAFGLASIKDLPGVQDLAPPTEARPATARRTASGELPTARSQKEPTA